MCLAGARWAQEHVLEAHRGSDVRVYVVWMPMLYGDARDAWNANVLRDPRVRHYWDGRTRLGLYLAGRQIGGLGGGVVWDAFYVFPSNARWFDEPAPAVGVGSPVVDDTDTFERALDQVL